MIIITVKRKTTFFHKVSKHFKEQRTLQQHQWYCKNKVEPGNLIDNLTNTGGYSKEARKARYDSVRRLLKTLDAQEKGTFILYFYFITRFIIIWIIIIEQTSESSPSNVLKIQDDEQEKSVAREWRKFKVDVCRIKLENMWWQNS